MRSVASLLSRAPAALLAVTPVRRRGRPRTKPLEQTRPNNKKRRNGHLRPRSLAPGPAMVSLDDEGSVVEIPDPPTAEEQKGIYLCICLCSLLPQSTMRTV
jgi:hypothetical protein